MLHNNAGNYAKKYFTATTGATGTDCTRSPRHTYRGSGRFAATILVVAPYNTCWTFTGAQSLAGCIGLAMCHTMSRATHLYKSVAGQPSITLTREKQNIV